MTGALGGDQRGVDTGRRSDLVEVDVEAVRAHQQSARLQVRQDRGPVDVALNFVGQQDVDQVGLLGGLFDGDRLEAILDGQIVVRTTGTLADDDGTAAVTQVLSLGVALASVSQNGDRLALEHGQIGVIVVIDLDRHG